MGIPITVFCGMVGAGKTTVILSLLKKIPPNLRCVLLKNEFGDQAVDSQLAKQTNVGAVREITNGCLCCILVGQMKTALLEIKDEHKPDRIIIECSGSAFPSTLAFQIRELERETERELFLDSICTVIDAENFEGYADTSPTAKMQASYTDLILINKWEHISERKLDIVMDHVHTLNDLTPKILCEKSGAVDPDLIFGIVRTEPTNPLPENSIHVDHHHDELQVVAISRGTESGVFTLEEITSVLDEISSRAIWRVKGFVRLQNDVRIVNWAFQRYNILEADAGCLRPDSSLELTCMGERGEVLAPCKRLASSFRATLQE